MDTPAQKKDGPALGRLRSITGTIVLNPKDEIKASFRRMATEGARRAFAEAKVYDGALWLEEERKIEAGL